MKIEFFDVLVLLLLPKTVNAQIDLLAWISLLDPDSQLVGMQRVCLPWRPLPPRYT